MQLILDSNIFIAALLKNSTTRGIITNFQGELIIPEIVFEEIENHKPFLIKRSSLSEEEFKQTIEKLSDYLTIVKTREILPYREKAKEIVENIDSDDVPFIAAFLAFNKCPIWSDDSDFQKQKTIKIYTTKELVDFLSNSLH